MSGGAVITFEAGSVGSAADNAAYITRESARDGGLVLHNAPEDVEVEDQHTQAGWKEQRMRLQTWAETRETEEIALHGNRKGQPRTHYRVTLSYEQKIPTEEAQEDAQEWLGEEFPDARAAAIVHQDTENTHTHIWMSPRKLDGSKINISPQDFRDLTAGWDQIYEERMQEKRFIERRGKRLPEKMEETRRFKQRYAELREQGLSEEELEQWANENRPDRVDPPSPEVYRKRDRRRIGREELEKAKQGVEKAKEMRVEKQLAEAKKAKRAGEMQLDRTSKLKQEQSNEREQERTRGDQRGADKRRQSPERGERKPSEESERPARRGSQKQRRQDRERSEQPGKSRKHSREGDDLGSDDDRSVEPSSRDDGGESRSMASRDRAQPSQDGDSRRSAAGGPMGDSDRESPHRLSKEDIEELNRDQREILDLVRRIHEASESEDTSKEEADLENQLNEARSDDVEELREAMSDELKQSMDDARNQSQSQSRSQRPRRGRGGLSL